jgi:hypothetical protein
MLFTPTHRARVDLIIIFARYGTCVAAHALLLIKYECSPHLCSSLKYNFFDGYHSGLLPIAMIDS